MFFVDITYDRYDIVDNDELMSCPVSEGMQPLRTPPTGSLPRSPRGNNPLLRWGGGSRWGQGWLLIADDDANAGDDGHGWFINLLPAALPQAVNPPAPDWPTSQTFSRLKSFLLQTFRCITAFPTIRWPCHEGGGMPPLPQSRCFSLHIEASQILSRGLGIVRPPTVGLFNFLGNQTPFLHLLKTQNWTKVWSKTDSKLT